MTVHFGPDVRHAAERSVLCWLATVDAAGQPNVTPKEVFAVADDEHLVIANIASPGSAANVAANPKRNWDIGLFQGMFAKNLLTFDPRRPVA